MKNLNDKKQEEKKLISDKEETNRHTKNIASIDSEKIESIRLFASIVIDAYFSKQENKKL